MQPRMRAPGTARAARPPRLCAAKEAGRNRRRLTRAITRATTDVARGYTGPKHIFTRYNNGTHAHVHTHDPRAMDPALEAPDARNIQNLKT